MTAIVTTGTRLFNSEQIKSSFDNSNPTKQYLFIGKPTTWADDNLPDAPVDSLEQDIKVRKDMLSLKLIPESDTSIGILRRDWVQGHYYDMYRHDYGKSGVYGVNLIDGSQTTPTSYLETNHYVVTDEYSVYMCMWNNNGAASQNKPTGTATSSFQTADGYIWKYMYTIAPADVLKFVSTNFVPVKKFTSNPGTEDSYYTQWLVQAAAVSGTVNRILVVSGGSGYPVSSTFPITVFGDGTGCTATVSTNSSGVITSATVTAIGSGYSWVTFSIPTGTGASLDAIIAPRGGYGSDAVTQLGGHYTLISASLSFDEGSGDFPQSNEYRRIGILRAPYNYGTSTISTAATLSAMRILELQLGVSGIFQADETVTGGTSGATATVVAYDSITRKVSLIQPVGQFGTFQVGETVTGGTSGAFGILSINTNPEVNSNTGDLIYLEHRRPIVRQIDQTEDIKIIIES